MDIAVVSWPFNIVSFHVLQVMIYFKLFDLTYWNWSMYRKPSGAYLSHTLTKSSVLTLLINRIWKLKANHLHMYILSTVSFVSCKFNICDYICISCLLIISCNHSNCHFLNERRCNWRFLNELRCLCCQEEKWRWCNWRWMHQLWPRLNLWK